MIRLLFGTWPRRALTLAVCGVAFIVSLTAALTVGILRLPTAADAARQIPVFGSVAVSLAEWRHGPLQGTKSDAEEDVETFRDLRPLTADEITDLIQSLKEQREIYLQKKKETENENKRLAVYRGELAEERKQIQTIKDQVGAQWDEIKKAREALSREVMELGAVEAKNLKQLAGTYEAMKPDRAALTVKKLDDATATKILYLMRERSTGKILEQLDEETAARLTEAMMLLKRTN